MIRTAPGIAVILALASAAAVAQGVAPGGPIGGSTGIGSGLGGINGTGPSWPNGTNQAPQPSIPSVPPGGYASPAPSSIYSAPQPSFGAPSTSPPSSTYRQPSEPFASSTVRPPAAIPLVLPERPNGSLVFLKGCWRSDIFPYGGHRGAITWCFDDKGGGRYLFARTDQTNYCHALAQARWQGGQLLLHSAKPGCDDGSADAPTDLTCRDGSDGALCSEPAQSRTVRLYRVR